MACEDCCILYVVCCFYRDIGTHILNLYDIRHLFCKVIYTYFAILFTKFFWLPSYKRKYSKSVVKQSMVDVHLEKKVVDVLNI